MRRIIRAAHERHIKVIAFPAGVLSHGRAGQLQAQALIGIYRDLAAIENQFADGGRIRRIKEGIVSAVLDINNIAYARGESQVWDDHKIGLQL